MCVQIHAFQKKKEFIFSLEVEKRGEIANKFEKRNEKKRIGKKKFRLQYQNLTMVSVPDTKTTLGQWFTEFCFLFKGLPKDSAPFLWWSYIPALIRGQSLLRGILHSTPFHHWRKRSHSSKHNIYLFLQKFCLNLDSSSIWIVWSTLYVYLGPQRKDVHCRPLIMAQKVTTR